jgi:hypothetical protein
MTPTPIDVTPRQLAAAISAVGFAADLPLMIWGDGGLGKSRIAEQAAAAAGRQYHDFRALIKDLPDLQGFPVLSRMEEGAPAPMTAPADLPDSGSTAAHCLVLEELPGASRMMQSALYGLILERRLNSYRLPANTRIIATGNMATSGGVTQSMPKPLASRFQHYRLVLCPEESLAYAQSAGWSPFVIAYHAHTKGTDWFSFDPKSIEETYACPRSWEMASRILNAGNIPRDILTPTLAGLLGYGIGQKFAAFLSLYSELAPTLAGLRSDPVNCPLPSDGAALWFIAATTAAAAGSEGKANPLAFARWAIPFLARLPDELCIFALDAAHRALPQIRQTPEFAAIVAANDRYAALAANLK